jgi:hypothetical protein
MRISADDALRCEISRFARNDNGGRRQPLPTACSKPAPRLFRRLGRSIVPPPHPVISSVSEKSQRRSARSFVKAAAEVAARFVEAAQTTPPSSGSISPSQFRATASR